MGKQGINTAWVTGLIPNWKSILEEFINVTVKQIYRGKAAFTHCVANKTVLPDHSGKYLV